MVFYANCTPCSIGDHANHNGTWSGTKGLIGGTQCTCSGNCGMSETAQRFLEEIFGNGLESNGEVDE